MFLEVRKKMYMYSRAEVKIRPLMGMGKIAYYLNMRKFINCEKMGNKSYEYM